MERSNQKSNISSLLFIDGIRAVAAIYVMLHHALLQYFPNFDAKGLTGWKVAFLHVFYYGHFAVNLFIVLSGFCLALPVLKTDFTLKSGTSHFYKRRIIRIIPPYLLAGVISLILIYFLIGERTGTNWDASIPVTLHSIITHIFLIQDFFTSDVNNINHVFWSIAVESRIYLLFPLILLCWRKLGPLVTLLITLIVSYLMHQILIWMRGLDSNIDLGTSGVSPYIVLFTCGMIAAYLSFGQGRVVAIARKIPIAPIFIIFFIANFFFYKYVTASGAGSDSFLSKVTDITFGICCSMLLIICSKQNVVSKLAWIRNIFLWKPLVFAGSFAYSIYLIHAPLLQVLTQYVINPFHLSDFNAFLALLLLSFIIILPLAYLFFLGCEKPFMVAGKKLNVKQTEIKAAVSPAP